MKKAFLIGALALALTPVTAAMAVPTCENLQFQDYYKERFGKPFFSQEHQARFIERQLIQRGIEASNTRFWNGCVQTFVRENGHTTMRFYDPDTLDEVPN